MRSSMPTPWRCALFQSDLTKEDVSRPKRNLLAGGNLDLSSAAQRDDVCFPRGSVPILE